MTDEDLNQRFDALAAQVQALAKQVQFGADRTTEQIA